MLETFGLSGKISSIKDLILTEPIGYLDFMRLMHQAKMILTDSGGIQEETTYLKIPCITIRENTERPVTVEQGTNVLVSPQPEMIINEVEKVISGNSKKGQIPELWDGKTAMRIVKILAERC